MDVEVMHYAEDVDSDSDRGVGVLIHIKGVYRVTSVLLWTCTACLESTAGLGPSLHLAEDSKQSGCTARGDWVGIEEHLLAG